MKYVLLFQGILTNVLQQERSWEETIEEALMDAGMQADRGKREPALLIRKMNERIKKKKEKITNIKARFVESFNVFYHVSFCFIHLLIYSLLPLFIRSLFHPFVYLVLSPFFIVDILLLVHSPFLLFFHSFIFSFLLSFIHSFVHSFVHFFIPSLFCRLILFSAIHQFLSNNLD